MYFNVSKTEITVYIAFSIHHHDLYQYINKKASIPWNSQLLVKFWVVNERKKRVDVADKINEDIFIAAQIKIVGQRFYKLQWRLLLYTWEL